MATFLLFQDIFYIQQHSKALHINGFIRMAPLQPNNTASCECFQMPSWQKKDPADDRPELFCHKWPKGTFSWMKMSQDKWFSLILLQTYLQGKADSIWFAALNLYRINMRSWYEGARGLERAGLNTLLNEQGAGATSFFSKRLIFRLWPRTWSDWKPTNQAPAAWLRPASENLMD